MRKKVLLISLFFLFISTAMIAQSLDDYVSETRGDTLVVKDDFAYGAPNTLTLLIDADTEAPAGRVYLLLNYGYYSLIDNPTTSSTQKTIIMGESNESVKTREGAAPPVICGAVYEGGSNTGSINSGYDLLLKNCNIANGNSSGSLGWANLGFAGPGLRFTLENCILEHTLWTTFGSVQADSKIYIRNNYFVNLDGHTCRRNGGVVDFNGGATQDTLLVENNTHVNVQGIIYKSRTGYTMNRQIFNHNNFINCSGSVFMNTGGHSNISLTNNIFVNCNVQPFSPVLETADMGEVDPDLLPMGLVNVRVDSAFVANGARFYANKNLAYWDESLSDVVSTVNSNAVNGATDWVSQMIPMNERTAALFDDDEYPLLTNGDWFLDKMPNFANTADLLTDQLAIVKEFSIATVDTASTMSLTSWRTEANPEEEYFTYADWPIPIDLAYDDADLLIAGLGGYPLGDLNWLPAQEAEWLTQRDAEYADIHTALTTGEITAVEGDAVVPNEYQLNQNYPNPFNPTTIISYKLAKAGNVSLKVYNSIGQEIATLVNGFQTAQTYKVSFDASALSSGVYFYTLNANNFVQSKKMVLMK